MLTWFALILFVLSTIAIAKEEQHTNLEDNVALHYNLEDETDTEGMEVEEEKLPKKLCKCKRHHKHKNRMHPAFTSRDIDELNVILNAEYLEAEFFLHAAYGFGLDQFNGTSLNVTGPAPHGAQTAHTGRFIEHLAKEFGLQSLGHIRSLFIRIF